MLNRDLDAHVVRVGDHLTPVAFRSAASRRVRERTTVHLDAAECAGVTNGTYSGGVPTACLSLIEAAEVGLTWAAPTDAADVAAATVLSRIADLHSTD
ncbi:hypothetical protein EFA46_012540 (plasmid) [Halarchaeum sp. CBA1220]|uniref:hypothetical protein n=1 Tax=Halarchaeum sp. CBA1220 TaxID=1853682 RepID=UPI000F3A9C4B|nr:hypothetical protein [Halarchaeum sp. CBA1220]QLC35078.1 hypothetical protein EFA46_012540 [Halarchaeum sp. CBA1220]